MAVLTVGPTSTYASIADAMLSAGVGDTILLESGYGNETATLAFDGMIVSGDASSTGIILQLSPGISTFTLAGAAPIWVQDAVDASSTGIVGNDGNNIITVTDGADAVNGGLGDDRLVVDYRLATGAVTGDSTSNFAEAGGSRLATVTNGTFEHFTVFTGSGADTITTGAGDDVINTGNGASTVVAGQGANRLTGGLDADTFTAGDGGNFMDGGDGANVMTSGGGNDTILSGTGADTIVSAGGNDLISVSGGADTANAGAGSDRLIINYAAMTGNVVGGVTTGNFVAGYSGHVEDGAGSTIDFQEVESFVITTGSGDDVILTGGGRDVLDGGLGSDTLDGGAGDDTIRGGAGSDLLTGGAGDDLVFGGIGSDAVTGGAGVDNLYGEAGDDQLYGGDDNDNFDGGAGADLMDGGAGSNAVYYTTSTQGATFDLGNLVAGAGDGAGDLFVNVQNAFGSFFDDVVYGSDVDNRLAARAGADYVDARGGADLVYGGDGNDIILGGTGLDNLYGEAGDDQIFGGEGNDNLQGGIGADVLDGGLGFDFAYFTSATSGVVADLGNIVVGAGEAAGDHFNFIDGLIGSNFDDTLMGDQWSNTLMGRAGDDRIDGGGLDDLLSGGGGSDTFAIDRADIGWDTILDFADDVDVIDLASWGFSNVAEALSFASDSGPHVHFQFSNGSILTVANVESLASISDDLLV